MASVNQKVLKTGHFLARSTLDSPAKTESDQVTLHAPRRRTEGYKGRELRSGAGVRQVTAEHLPCAAAAWVEVERFRFARARRFSSKI